MCYNICPKCDDKRPLVCCHMGMGCRTQRDITYCSNCNKPKLTCDKCGIVDKTVEGYTLNLSFNINHIAVATKSERIQNLCPKCKESLIENVKSRNNLK